MADWFDEEWEKAMDVMRQRLRESFGVPPHHLGERKVEEDEEANLVVVFDVDGDGEEPSAVREVTPPAPTGVVIHYQSGAQQKAELVWVGTTLDGLHVWEITTRPRFHDVNMVTIEVLPPQTMIQMGGPDGP